MKDESQRLSTFRLTRNGTQQWPLEFIKPEDMAEAGFFYLINQDRVQCAFCRGVVCGWEPGDIPLSEHSRHFPRCPFVLHEDCGNIPLRCCPGPGQVTNPQNGYRIAEGYDVCGNYLPEELHRPRAQAPANPLSSSLIAVNGKQVNMSDFGVIEPIDPTYGPRKKDLIFPDSRKRTFETQNWNPVTPVSVDKLIEAGFYYIGSYKGFCFCFFFILYSLFHLFFSIFIFFCISSF